MLVLVCDVSCVLCPSVCTAAIPHRTSFSMSDDEGRDISHGHYHGHVSNEEDCSDSGSSLDVAPSAPSCSKSPFPPAAPVVLPPPAPVARRRNNSLLSYFSRDYVFCCSASDAILLQEVTTIIQRHWISILTCENNIRHWTVFSTTKYCSKGVLPIPHREPRTGTSDE